jgi:hypothetical protein
LLSKQAKDVEILTKKMKSQFKKIQQEHDKELTELEDLMVEERKYLRNQQNAEFEALAEERRNKEG